MVQEPELEGETGYYKDDANLDPDIALSYIGDKVQSILGHLQIDFEGGVCAENLGAKFGGYGSFLPIHQCSPSIWLQPKSPPRVQIFQSPRPPNACPEVYGTVFYQWFIHIHRNFAFTQLYGLVTSLNRSYLQLRGMKLLLPQVCVYHKH